MINEREVIQITNINIIGLYGKFDFQIKIKDNRIIFVAYNGAFKSTVLRIIYLFLSVQLDKLDKMEFDSIKVVLKGGKEIKYQVGDRKDWYKKAIQTIGKKEGMQKIIDGIMKSSNPITKLDEYMLKKDGNIEHLLDLKKSILHLTIPEFANLTVLYLPTYRKIEQDFESIYEGIEYISQKNTNSLLSDFMSDFYNKNKVERIAQYHSENLSEDENENLVEDLGDEELKSLPIDRTERMRLYANIYEEYSHKIKIMKLNSIELTEFGMQHVKELIEVSKDKAFIEDFVNLVNQYLVKDKFQVSDDDEEEIELDEIYKSLQKKIIYSDNKISLKQIASGTLIDLDHLSSGEKQIVTLFAYLLLSGDKNFFVLFDEPELSLSVLWQENILDDILKLISVKGLIAATHSPNVIKKRLSFACDLTDFMEEQK